jgi:peptidyl-prolyl cis-trans isomerase SurA
LGYHIIKVEDIRGDEVRARHILIRLTIDETDEMRVAKKLKQIRDDILSGKSTFEEMAKQYSEDENSRELGGKLDWFARDVMIPSFPREVEKIEKGQISEPFKSQFGYHILRLDDHKPSHTLNIKDDRTQIEELIKQKKTIEEYYRIINQLREETYIDIRLD